MVQLKIFTYYNIIEHLPNQNYGMMILGRWSMGKFEWSKGGE